MAQPWTVRRRRRRRAREGSRLGAAARLADRRGHPALPAPERPGTGSRFGSHGVPDHLHSLYPGGHARLDRGGHPCEVVPTSVELRWRPVVRQAATTCSSCTAGVTVLAISASSAVRSLARCRWPLTRRNCLPASIMPAAHQRSAICPSRQRLTLLAWVRQMLIMLSTALVERNVRASVGGTFRRSTVRVSASPSRKLAAAPGWVRSSSAASADNSPSAANAESA